MVWPIAFLSFLIFINSTKSESSMVVLNNFVYLMKSGTQRYTILYEMAKNKTLLERKFCSEVSLSFYASLYIQNHTTSLP
jgi:hypothetical protein